MTLGSLFDGAGTFPFAAQICGIETMWSSEIEPFPLAVTAKRFPNVKQLGDVTKINGAEIDPVDIITFGSPCQDLSVAGQRKGLDGERSGLFMEAVRIIKEMRARTDGIYPRYAVWENVPGAFSSNKGEDFRIVLEQLCQIKDGASSIPRPAKGKWSDAGEIVADEYSVAWRVLDAQFWGVPQRRRRIFFVADFRGDRAGEILFEREGLSRDFAESRETWKGITKSLAYRADTRCWDARGNGDGNISPTVTGDHNNRVTDYSTICCYAIGNGQCDNTGLHKQFGALNCMHDQQAILCMATQQGGAEIGKDVCPTITAAAGMSGNNQPVLCVRERCGCDGGGKGCLVYRDNAGSIKTKEDQFLCYAIQGNCIDHADTAGCNGKGWNDETMYTLNTIDRPAVVYTMDRASFNKGQNAQYQPKIDDSGVCPCLVARGPHAVGICERIRFILRRITPTECARLQGMPDWWCDDVPHSDSAEYKMWGNGIALPCALYVMEGLKGVEQNG